MSVAWKNRYMAESAAYNTLDFIIHASKGLYARRCAALSVMHFPLAAATGFHSVAAMTAH